MPSVRPPIVATLLLTFLVSVPEAEAQREARSIGLPIIALPAQVDAPDEKFSLFADFGSVGIDGRVPIYIVNRSSTEQTLHVQDGDLYLKLEYRDGDGNWVRAQPHTYSWCGVSYYRASLAPGHFVRVSGYQPVNGEGARIRYSFYGQNPDMSSNSGQGVVMARDIERASMDAMSVRSASFEQLKELVLRPASEDNWMNRWNSGRLSAVSMLGSGKFDRVASRAILEEAKLLNPDLERAVDYALEWLDEEGDAE